MMFRSKKGVSLPLETVVLLILAAVVLGALLSFFLGIFTPTQSETELTRKQFTICQEVFNKDNLCRPTNVEVEARKLIDQGVCKSDRPGCNPIGTKSSIENCIATCCRIFCPTG